MSAFAPGTNPARPCPKCKQPVTPEVHPGSNRHQLRRLTYMCDCGYGQWMEAVVFKHNRQSSQEYHKLLRYISL